MAYLLDSLAYAISYRETAEACVTPNHHHYHFLVALEPRGVLTPPRQIGKSARLFD